LVVENGLPGPAEVRRSKNAAVDLGHVKDIGLGRNAGDGAGSTAAKRTNIAPTQCLTEIQISFGASHGRLSQDERDKQKPAKERAVMGEEGASFSHQFFRSEAGTVVGEAEAREQNAKFSRVSQSEAATGAGAGFAQRDRDSAFL
jgi:hypothetical protein